MRRKTWNFPSDKLSCPFGHTCTECFLFVKIEGQDTRTNEPIDDYECAIVVNALMTQSVDRQVVRATNATLDLRNQTVERQDRLLHMVQAAPQLESDIES